MDELTCPACETPIVPGERRVSWFTKDERVETSERGAVHLACLLPSSDGTR